MPSAKVSSKHQITIPSEARRRLGIEPGDRLNVDVVDDRLVLRRRPERASDTLRGLGTGLYPPDPVTFVRSLRDEWEAHAREREATIGRALPARAPADGAGQQRVDLPPRVGGTARRPGGRAS